MCVYICVLTAFCLCWKIFVFSSALLCSCLFVYILELKMISPADHLLLLWADLWPIHTHPIAGWRFQPGVPVISSSPNPELCIHLDKQRRTENNFINCHHLHSQACHKRRKASKGQGKVRNKIKVLTGHDHRMFMQVIIQVKVKIFGSLIKTGSSWFLSLIHSNYELNDLDIL